MIDEISVAAPQVANGSHGELRGGMVPVCSPLLRKRRHWIMGAVGLIVLIAIVAASLGGPRRAKVAYTTKPVIRGELQKKVEATGTINAVTTVQVGSQVSGSISRLYVDFNSHVRKGDLIGEVDPRLYEGQLLQARADLENARANLAAAEANSANAKAKAVQARADYARTVPLGDRGIVSPQQIDSAKAAADSADAQVAASEAVVKQAQAQVEQREAALTVAQTNLAYTKIYAPIDGTVINRAVDVGQTVAASFQTPTLFTIARDLAKMQLHVSTNEGDVGSVKVGLPVSFRVDAFPGEVFNGHVSQVRMNATTVQNVVTYETIVDFENPDLKLFPGMTAYVVIPVHDVKDALTVPNTAIRFKPNKSRSELMALFQTYGLDISAVGKDAKAASGANTAVVWKIHPDRDIEPVLIKTGITDHSSTVVMQVVNGTLVVGDQVVTAEQSPWNGLGAAAPR